MAWSYFSCDVSEKISKNAVSERWCSDSSLCIDYHVESCKFSVIHLGSMLPNLKGH